MRGPGCGGDQLRRGQTGPAPDELFAYAYASEVTAGLLTDFGPTRVIDTRICEEGFVGVAIGASIVGMRPVVEIMTINFTLLAIDQIVNTAKMHHM